MYGHLKCDLVKEIKFNTILKVQVHEIQLDQCTLVFIAYCIFFIETKPRVRTQIFLPDDMQVDVLTILIMGSQRLVTVEYQGKFGEKFCDYLGFFSSLHNKYSAFKSL